MLLKVMRTKIHRALVTHVDLNVVIITGYAWLDEEEARHHRDHVVLVNHQDRVIQTR